MDQILDQVTTPGRYRALELNAARQDLASVRLKAALVFPDTYEVGMSHLGVRILYHLLNDRDGIACERAYAPWADMEAILRRERIPLASLESALPLGQFDLLGFSLTYELCYTNVLNVLDLAGIPLLAAEREQGPWPVVIGGGPCASNPEPMADFFDAFLFGDGEEAVLEIAQAVTEWKEAREPKSRLRERLAAIAGVYVPAFFSPEYLPDGRLKEMRALRPGYERVTRRIVADLDSAYFPERPLAPVLEPVHDRVMVEIARGCGRGCRFCHAGVIYRPVRERSVDKVLALARLGLSATGYEECSLLALSAGDYAGLGELLGALIREHYGSRVSVSLPSLRVQGLDDAMLRAIETVRKTGFTLAPEAGTDRLRRVINKDYTEAELMDTARRVFNHGWRNLKLYFMVGLPTETDLDLAGIVRMVDEISRMKGAQGRPQLSVSLSGFVPKPHTPFQWEAQASVERLERVHDFFRREFAGRGKRVKWQNPRQSRLEGIMSRGDRRLGAAILEAFRRGQRFDGWSEHFRAEVWEEAFAAAGIDPEIYLLARGPDEVLPWDRLDPRVSRAWLREERERALREEMSPDCRRECTECGVCAGEVKPRLGEARPGVAVTPLPERKAEPEAFFLYRVRYARREEMRLLGQLDVTRLFTRAVRRARLPIRYSQGYHPLPRIKFGPSPPLGVASEAEFLDLELVRRLPAEEIGRRLQEACPPGIAIREAHELPPKSAPISAIITGFDYAVGAPEGVGFDPDLVASFLALDRLVVKQQREKGEREVDLRSRVKSLAVGEDGGLTMSLRVTDGPGVKPQEVVRQVFGFSDEQTRALEFVRLTARFKEARPLRYSGRGERVRRVRTVRRERP